MVRQVVGGVLLAVAILLAAIVSVGSSDAATDTTPHLLVVPATPDGEGALGHSAARIVAHYDSYTLVEASGADAKRLIRAGADQRDDLETVTLRGRRVDPRSQRKQLGGKGGPQPQTLNAGGPGLALAQFVGPVKDAWLARLEKTGVRVVSYMAQDGYLVYGDGPQLAELARMHGNDPAIRSVIPFEAPDKLTEPLPTSGTVQVAIQTLAGTPGDDARRQIDATGSEVRPTAAVGAYRTQFARLDANSVRRLADNPGVLAVQPYQPPQLRDERAAQIVAGNLTGNVPSGTGYLSWLTTNGFSLSPFDFAVDLTDEGLDKGVLPPPAGSHPDFFQGGSTANPTRIAYQTDWTKDSDARDCGGHGTNVASIATGYNDQPGTGNNYNDAAGFNYGQGIAPQAKLGASKVFGCSGLFEASNLTTLTSSAYANGARISSNSWGSDTGGGYDADSQEYDALVRDARPTVAGNQEMVEVFAAGNAGPTASTVGSPGTAKNVITVGASENVRAIGGSDGCLVPDSGANDARDIIDFSSRGPTSDSRLKPDVVAPGTHVSGASPQDGASYNGSGTCNQTFPAGNPLYSLVSGTSQATPEVSGTAALVRDWYRRSVGGNVTPPSPAMTKAILVNTANDQVGGQDGDGGVNTRAPNDTQGWGRIDMGNVLDGTTRYYRDQTDVLGASGASVTRTFSVPDASKPLKVTLAWTDPPGPLTGNAFVNDLDLVVVAGGQTYKGNALTNGVSVTGGSADPRNNVESVVLPPGVTGTVAVTVRGTNIAGDGVPGNADSTDQDFALVVSNATEHPNQPLLAHDLTTVHDAAGGDGDGAAEPGESIDLDERLQNLGTGSATGISGTLSTSSGGVAVTQPSSAYPDIASGANGTNTTPFSASIDPGVACGSTLHFALSVTTAQGSATVPFDVPTGAGGGPVARDSSDVPKTIPDLGTAQSTLSVAQAGTIKDVNVRIGSIVHTYDADLRISLIGPDATTVVLSDRRGGGDNNFTNTVFDDGAATPIAAGSAPFTGSFRPEGSLSAFDGKQQQGTWTLKVEDLVAGDAGTLQSWGSDLSPALCSSADKTPPQTTIDAGPPSTTNDSTPTFSFSSSESPSTFECKVDSGSFASCSSPFTTTTLGDGQHTFQVRATDASSNVDATPASQTFTVDTVAPDTSLDGGPPSPTNDSTPTFTFSSLDSSATFECRVGAAAFAACSSPFTTAALADGSRTFQVRAKDPAGNVDASPAGQTFTVDTTAPAVTLTAPGAGSATSDPTPTLAGAGGSASGDAATVTVAIYPGASATGSAVEEFTAPVSSGSWTTSASPALPDGVYTAQARQVDNAGNTGLSAARTFTVDTQAPDTSIDSGPSGSTTETSPAFSFSSTESGAQFQCSVDSAAFAACSSPTTAGPLGAGAHSFAVRSIDAAGNTDATPASRAFTVTASGGSGGSTGGSTGTPSAPTTPTTPTTPPDTPPSSGGPVVTPDLTAPNLTIATSKTRAHRNRIPLRLRCPTSEPGGCLGTVVLKSGRTVVGRTAFRVAGGRTASITIVLTRSAARLLARHSRLRVTASAAVRDLAGNRKTVRRSLVIVR